MGIFLHLQRIARRLLAEGKASNYDEAEVAASLLALKFGDVEALQAAKECSSIESALAFLQQECELCTGRFAMSQVFEKTKYPLFYGKIYTNYMNYLLNIHIYMNI